MAVLVLPHFKGDLAADGNISHLSLVNEDIATKFLSRCRAIDETEAVLAVEGLDSALESAVLEPGRWSTRRPQRRATGTAGAAGTAGARWTAVRRSVARGRGAIAAGWGISRWRMAARRGAVPHGRWCPLSSGGRIMMWRRMSWWWVPMWRPLMWWRPIPRRRRSIAVAGGRWPIARRRRTAAIVARRWIAVAMGRVAVRRRVAVGRIGIWRWMIVWRSMWWWMFVSSRWTVGTWWISAMSRRRPTRPIRRWSLRWRISWVSWTLRRTSRRTWTWSWSARSPGLRRPRILPPARASSPPRAAAAAAATATSPGRSTAPRSTRRIWRRIRITSWRRRSGAYRGARRRRRRRCGARGRVHREARLTGEGLAIRIELSDRDMSFPALQANDQLVTDGEVSMREPCPHLICSEGPELRPTAVQVKPF